MFIKRGGRSHILINNRDKSKEADTLISQKVQLKYKQMCEILKLKYKFLADAPKLYRSMKDDRNLTWDEYSRANLDG